MKYTDQQLVRHSVSDLINDWRANAEHFASGDMVKYHDADAMVALCEYAYDCREKAIAIFKNRHSAKIGRYGEVKI